jgi:hypothetical protein
MLTPHWLFHPLSIDRSIDLIDSAPAATLQRQQRIKPGAAESASLKFLKMGHRKSIGSIERAEAKTKEKQASKRTKHTLKKKRKIGKQN